MKKPQRKKERKQKGIGKEHGAAQNQACGLVDKTSKKPK